MWRRTRIWSYLGNAPEGADANWATHHEHAQDENDDLDVPDFCRDEQMDACVSHDRAERHFFRMYPEPRRSNLYKNTAPLETDATRLTTNMIAARFQGPKDTRKKLTKVLQSPTDPTQVLLLMSVYCLYLQRRPRSQAGGLAGGAGLVGGGVGVGNEFHDAREPADPAGRQTRRPGPALEVVAARAAAVFGRVAADPADPA